jgi:hypothetical protein
VFSRLASAGMCDTEELNAVKFGWQNSILVNFHLIFKISYLPSNKARFFIQKQGVTLHLKMNKHVKKSCNSMTSGKIRHFAITGVP